MEVMKVFITAYALTNKILTMQGIVDADGMMFVPFLSVAAPVKAYESRDWAFTREGAIAQALLKQSHAVEVLVGRASQVLSVSDRERVLERIHEVEALVFDCDESDFYPHYTEERAKEEYLLMEKGLPGIVGNALHPPRV